MKRPLVLAAIIALGSSVTLPAVAADSGWHLRVVAAGFEPDLDVLVPAENPDMVRVAADSDLGFGASLEHQLSDLLGLELGMMRASSTIELSADIPGYGHLFLTDSMSTTR
jgi:hypothetical protein